MEIIADNHAAILLFALLLDGVIGDPDWLWRRLPHPVSIVGRLIGWLEIKLNRDWLILSRKMAGMLTILLVVGVSGVAGSLLQELFASGWIGPACESVLVAVFLAQRSLYEHVHAVYLAFASNGLEGPRNAVSMIVGRDAQQLDEAGICRAAIETSAENFSDGVVAPAMWYLIGGLPGILIYKAVNTADSMIGYRNERYLEFGWAAARLDDVLNLVPARFSVVFIIAAGAFTSGMARAKAGMRAVLHDAGKHHSPNAGWPEAAMAGVLGLALAGPRQYGSIAIEAPWINEADNQKASPDDIRKCSVIFIFSCLFFVLFAFLSFISSKYITLADA